MILGVCCSAKAQSFAINTDLTMLALQTYNIGAEMRVGNRSTLGLSVFGNNKPYFHKELRGNWCLHRDNCRRGFGDDLSDYYHQENNRL